MTSKNPKINEIEPHNIEYLEKGFETKKKAIADMTQEERFSFYQEISRKALDAYYRFRKECDEGKWEIKQ